MNQTQAQIMDPVTSEIDWTNKLNKYKNVFALSIEEFKKFAIIQNKKVSGKDKEIAQLLKTDTNIVLAVTTKQEEVTKEVLIKQERGCQDYAEEVIEYKYISASHNKNSNLIIINNCMVGHINTKATKTTTQNMDCSKVFSELTKTESKIQKETEQTRAQSTSSQNKQCKIVEKGREYSANDINTNMHVQMVTTKKEEKLKECKQRCSGSKDQNLETTKNITHKKKGKAKQVSDSVIQEKENCEILVVMLQILTRLNKLKEQQENKKRNSAAIKDINRVFQKLKKKGELIDLKDKKDLKMI
ncbi:44674_t:CDS:2 [Gigaspora margarita]|uniref:44674_t:CDS:1 n=1 Tax=Gigaspora margarita TaxID=4874 RepID=A0ABM8W1Z7_GIGMA|nr:44674_t:CDS:2 [Gigaspora margarita]